MAELGKSTQECYASLNDPPVVMKQRRRRWRCVGLRRRYGVQSNESAERCCRHAQRGSCSGRRAGEVLCRWRTKRASAGEAPSEATTEGLPAVSSRQYQHVIATNAHRPALLQVPRPPVRLPYARVIPNDSSPTDMQSACATVQRIVSKRMARCRWERQTGGGR